MNALLVARRKGVEVCWVAVAGGGGEEAAGGGGSGDGGVGSGREKRGWQKLAPVGNAPLEGVNRAKGTREWVAGGGSVDRKLFLFCFYRLEESRRVGRARKSQLKM